MECWLALVFKSDFAKPLVPMLQRWEPIPQADSQHGELSLTLLSEFFIDELLGLSSRVGSRVARPNLAITVTGSLKLSSSSIVRVLNFESSNG